MALRSGLTIRFIEQIIYLEHKTLMNVTKKARPLA